jgi:hypothetical protein
MPAPVDVPAPAEEPADHASVGEEPADEPADGDFDGAPTLIRFPRILPPAEGEDDDEMAGDADLDDLTAGEAPAVEPPTDRGH